MVFTDREMKIVSCLAQLLLQSCIKNVKLILTWLLSQTIGRVWTYYCLLFEIKEMSTILEAIIKKLIHHLGETAGENVSKSTG